MSLFMVPQGERGVQRMLLLDFRYPMERRRATVWFQLLGCILKYLLDQKLMVICRRNVYGGSKVEYESGAWNVTEEGKGNHMVGVTDKGG